MKTVSWERATKAGASHEYKQSSSQGFLQDTDNGAMHI